MAETADLASLLAHADWLRALARRLVGPASADDAVQETYIAALRSPPDADRPPRPWLARVLRNTTRMHHRGESRRAAREDASAVTEAVADAMSAQAASPETAVARAETFRMVVDLVLALDEPYRATLVRHYFDGEPLADIARRERVPEGTVRWRHKEALAQLRARLDARTGGDRRAWLAALAPLAAPASPHVAATAAAGGFLVTKVLIGAALAAIAAGAVAWRLTSSGQAAPAAAAIPARAEAGLAATAPVGSATAAPSPLAHVRRLGSAEERRALAEQIAQAQAARAAARAAARDTWAGGGGGGGPAPSLPAGSGDSGPLDKATIRGAMREVIPMVTECYDAHVAATGAQHLEIHAHLRLTGDPQIGTIVDAEQLFDDEQHPLPVKLDDCLRSTFQQMELPPIGDGETVEVNYPLVFSTAPLPEGSAAGSAR